MHRRGMTSRELAHRMGVPETRVIAYMSGMVRPQSNTFPKIERALGTFDHKEAE
ncbi:helix-turn-helix domain-containing protein [Lacticaseibacillus songhuajiangensis]|uniref:helix-turn-helix domain-containing protein n=1 Tax=Lacticaseibacillus songhuajiangensis TaxID=1296539 RepID=UPI001CDCDA1F